MIGPHGTSTLSSRPTVSSRRGSLPEVGALPVATTLLTVRTSEVRQLHKAIAQARNGQGRPVLLSGDMGLGKTTLLHATADQLRQESAGGAPLLWFSLDLANGAGAADLAGLLREAIHTGARQSMALHLSRLNAIATASDLPPWPPARLTEALTLLNTHISEPLATQREILREFLPGRVVKPAAKRAGSATDSPDSAQAQAAAEEQVMALLRSPWAGWSQAVVAGDDSVVQTLDELAERAVSVQGLDEDGLSRLAQLTLTLTRTLDELAAMADVAVVWVIDHWDTLADWPEADRQRAKTWLGHWLATLSDQRDTHHLIVVAARSESQSLTLGGSLGLSPSAAGASGPGDGSGPPSVITGEGLALVNLRGKPLSSAFRSRILLAPWTPEERLDWLNSPQPGLTPSGSLTPATTTDLPLPQGIVDTLAAWSEGNPFWLTVAHRLVMDHWRQGLLVLPPTVATGDEGGALWLLGFEHHDDLVEWLMSRLLLPFLNQEAALCQVLLALFDQVGTRAFAMEDTLQALTRQTGQPPAFLFEVLRHLFLLNLIEAAPLPPALSWPDNIAEPDLALPAPQYRLPCRPLTRIMSQWLRRRYPQRASQQGNRSLMGRSIERLIPLSLQTGELTPDKLQAVVALGSRLGHSTLMTSIETSLLDTLNDPEASLATRLTALSNLTPLRSPGAARALRNGLTDFDQPPVYRETCLRGLLLWQADPAAGSLVSGLQAPGLPAAGGQAAGEQLVTLTGGQTSALLADHLQTTFLAETDLACQTLLLTLLARLQQANSGLAPSSAFLSPPFLSHLETLLGEASALPHPDTDASRTLPPALRRAILALITPELGQAESSHWLAAFLSALTEPDDEALVALALEALTRQAASPEVAQALHQLIAAPETSGRVRRQAFSTLAHSVHGELAHSAFAALLAPPLWSVLEEADWLSLLRDVTTLPTDKAQALLYDWLEKAYSHQLLTPVLVWRWVRSLGMVGDSEVALQVLDKLSPFAMENEYLGAALTVAREGIRYRQEHPARDGRRVVPPVDRSRGEQGRPSADIDVAVDAPVTPISPKVGTIPRTSAPYVETDPGTSDMLDDLLNELSTTESLTPPTGSRPAPPVITDEAFETFFVGTSGQDLLDPGDMGQSGQSPNGPAGSLVGESAFPASVQRLPGLIQPWVHKILGWLGVAPESRQLPDTRPKPAGLLPSSRPRNRR